MNDEMKVKDRCLIVGAAGFYAERVGDVSDAYIIAVDGGYKSLIDHDIIPDAVIGDFDSLGYTPARCSNIIRLPVKKDDTDSFYAAKHALWQGYRKFYLCGCAGGKRPEHTFANISLMLYLSRHGATRVIMEGMGEMYSVVSAPCKLEFSGERGNFSVFALSERVSALTLRGFEYETEKITLCSDIPLGVSNSFKDDICTLEAEKGDMLLIWEK